LPGKRSKITWWFFDSGDFSKTAINLAVVMMDTSGTANPLEKRCSTSQDRHVEPKNGKDFSRLPTREKKIELYTCNLYEIDS
jgi:hypothetical protein